MKGWFLVSIRMQWSNQQDCHKIFIMSDTHTLQMTPSQSKIKTSTPSNKFSAGSVSFITFAIFKDVVLQNECAFVLAGTKDGLVREIADFPWDANAEMRGEDDATIAVTKPLVNFIILRYLL